MSFGNIKCSSLIFQVKALKKIILEWILTDWCGSQNSVVGYPRAANKSSDSTCLAYRILLQQRNTFDLHWDYQKDFFWLLHMKQGAKAEESSSRWKEKWAGGGGLKKSAGGENSLWKMPNSKWLKLEKIKSNYMISRILPSEIVVLHWQIFSP